ncbi:hypothetical protein J132_03436 [Termitomyces sp. J132]|nr:hypothetical protein J132_03436 [Termitomyces sp. J132]
MKGGIGTGLTVNVRSSEELGAVVGNLTEKEDAGFFGHRNAGLLRATLGHLRMHTEKITIRDITDSPESEMESKARKMARKAVDNQRLLALPLIPTELHLIRAKLSKITQAKAYKWLREMSSPIEQPRTTRMLKEIRDSVEETCSKRPSIQQVWKSMKSRDFPRQIRIFLWNSAHNAYKVGSYWDCT